MTLLRYAKAWSDRFWEVPAFEVHLPLGSQWFVFGVAWVLIGAFVLLCGWVEDVAARKPPRLLPGGPAVTPAARMAP